MESVKMEWPYDHRRDRRKKIRVVVYFFFCGVFVRLTIEGIDKLNRACISAKKNEENNTENLQI